MDWNKQQQQAIEARGNVLVSAGAGSGKTAVLTERIVQLIAKEKCSIMDFAICTFTEAATLEMKTRIREALMDREMFDEADKVFMADISTIHAMGSRVVREHGDVIGLPPKLSVLSDETVLQGKAMDEAINTLYEQEDFLAFATDISPVDDKSIRGLIFDLYGFASGIPDFDSFMAKQIAMYETKDFSPITAEYYQSKAVELEEILQEYDALLETVDFNEEEHQMMESDISELEGLKQALKDGRTCSCTFKRAPDGASNADIFNVVRKKAKAIVSAIGYFGDILACNEVMDRAERDIKMAYKSYSTFADIYGRIKLEEGYLTYGDMEAYAYEILKDQQVHEFYHQRYKYIFVDEYQDTSKIQQAILESISTGDNMFMVGDVKQSIYGFRNADPTTFYKIYQSYGKESGKTKIDLPVNYRSTENILNCVNQIFSGLLNLKNEYYPRDAYLTTLDNHDDKPVDVDLVVEVNKGIDEALHIARRIEKLVSEEHFAYKDIAVLFQSVKTPVAEALYNLLRQKGIPVVISTNVDQNYMETRLFIDYLSIIDNPNQDIPLASVMYSEIGGFTIEDMIAIKSGKRSSLYTCATEYEGEGKLKSKLEGFFTKARDFRYASQNMPVDEFMSMVLSGYFKILEGHEDSKAKTTQLYSLLRRGREYEAMGNLGLSGFLHYYSKQASIKGGEDEGGYTEGSDAVTIVTVHKSKGLAFPVVILGETGKQFFRGKKDSSHYALHKDLGVGLTISDGKRQAKLDSPAYMLIKERKKLDKLEEEMRLLYVAMTRPRKKLIIVGSVKEGYAEQLEEYGQLKLRDLIGGNTTYLQCILSAIYAGDSIGKFNIGYFPGGELADVSKPMVLPDQNATIDELLNTPMDTTTTKVPKKASVTGLTKEENQVTVHVRHRVKKTNNGAMAGTVIHGALSIVRPGENAEQVLARMSQGEYFTPEDLQLADINMIQGFLDSDLYRRMQGADKIYREKAFILELPENSKYSAEPAMVQGIIDCLFQEDGEFILVDYKTDNIGKNIENVLIEKYSKQLEIYAYAVEQLTGITVRERLIYHLPSKKTILIP